MEETRIRGSIITSKKFHNETDRRGRVINQGKERGREKNITHIHHFQQSVYRIFIPNLLKKGFMHFKKF